jgi:hypothetical protein
VVDFKSNYAVLLPIVKNINYKFRIKRLSSCLQAWHEGIIADEAN